MLLFIASSLPKQWYYSQGKEQGVSLEAGEALPYQMVAMGAVAAAKSLMAVDSALL